MTRARCESIEDQTGDRCRCYAHWIIGVSTRMSDKQLACGRHLHSASRAMAAAEGRAGVTLTLTPI